MHENVWKKPKCTHAFILHLFHMIKSLPIVSILYHFGPLMNFQIYTWDFLPFKPISHLSMVCYHQNPIGRTLGLTKSNKTSFMRLQNVAGVKNPRLLRSHALDHVGCMQIYLRLSKSIATNKQVFKNNMDTIENIDLENKVTYIWSGCSQINSNWCR